MIIEETGVSKLGQKTVKKRCSWHQKHKSYTKSMMMEKGAKFKKGDVAKPMKNTPSQDGAEGEQVGRRYDFFTRR